MIRITLFIAIGLLCLPLPAFADCTNPAGSEGKALYNGDHKTFQYCDGIAWIAMHPAGSGTGGCTDPAGPEGAMIYNADHRVIQGCAGNIWRAMAAVAPTSVPALDTAARSAMGADLSGSDKWEGVVLGPDGKIYGIPRSSTDILIIDPAAGTATRSAMGADLSGSGKWESGVLGPDGKIYGVPRNSTDILIIDPVAGTAVRDDMGANLSDSNKWTGGVLGPEGKIYGIPRNSTDILIIDPDAGTATRSNMGANLSGSLKWTGGVLGNDGKIYGIPYSATDILIIDPDAGTATRSNMGANLSGSNKWNAGVLGPDGKIYGIPRDSTDILIIDPVAETAVRDDMGADLSGLNKWYGGVRGSDGRIYGIPVNSTSILIIDPVAGTATVSDMGADLSDSSKWRGGVLAGDGKIYALPNNSETILIVSGSRACTDPDRPEGTLLYNSSGKVMQYCDGANWIAVGKPPPLDCPDIGDVCTDGTVYAGLSPDGDVKMFTTPADAGLISYNAGSATADCEADPNNCVDTAMENCTDGPPGTAASCRTGAANTTFLVGLSNIESPYEAAVYCDGLDAHGHQDWYLPAQDELYVLYTNRAAIGGFSSGGFPDSSYWSSSERARISAMRVRFSDGVVTTNHKNVALSVRCVRKN